MIPTKNEHGCAEGQNQIMRL